MPAAAPNWPLASVHGQGLGAAAERLMRRGARDLFSEGTESHKNRRGGIHLPAAARKGYQAKISSDLIGISRDFHG